MDSAMISDKRGTLVVVAGPTGSGKTEVGVELARRLGAPIISTDSRQVFRGMAVGTAQPSAEQQAAALHYFIADREVSDDYNAGRFEAEALELLDRLFVTHDYVLAVGGSGLYIDALCHGFDALPPAEPALRAQLEARLREEGLGSLLEELRRFAPVYYESVDRSNPSRVLRAVEVCIQTGRPYSEQRSGEPRERPFRILKIGIKVGREELYGRIDRRVDGMLASGLEEEARRLWPLRGLNALMTVGYREMFDYFDGKITYDEAVRLIKRNSRRYAKRQMTWFRRDAEMVWFGRDEIKMMENFCKKFAE